MRKAHHTVKNSILVVIDFFYPLFKRVMPLQTFRYAACGGFNTVLDISLFAFSYNFILRKQNVHIAAFTISPHIAAFLIAFGTTFPIGFYLSRYVVFQQSPLKRNVQLVRYFSVVLCCIVLNYVFLKAFVEYFHWYPTPAKAAATLFIVVFSYLSQTYYSFGLKRK